MFSKISPILHVIKPSGAGCDQWPPSQTYGSQWGLTCYNSLQLLLARTLSMMVGISPVFSTEALAPSCTKKIPCCLCLTHAYLGSSGGKGGSMMAFVEDKFIVKASWSNFGSISPVCMQQLSSSDDLNWNQALHISLHFSAESWSGGLKFTHMNMLLACCRVLSLFTPGDTRLKELSAGDHKSLLQFAPSYGQGHKQSDRWIGLLYYLALSVHLLGEPEFVWFGECFPRIWQNEQREGWFQNFCSSHGCLGRHACRGYKTL